MQVLHADFKHRQSKNMRQPSSRHAGRAGVMKDGWCIHAPCSCLRLHSKHEAGLGQGLAMHVYVHAACK
jgi:hypothetical protein